MEMRPLTAWEERERAGLLALETPEWREKRLVAEDPNTTGEVVERFADEVVTVWKNSFDGEFLRADMEPIYLLAEALAAHPNTPLASLLDLLMSEDDWGRRRAHFYPEVIFFGRMYHYSPVGEICVRGICRNPILPLVCLEMPDFWQRVDELACHRLLCEPSLPANAVKQFMQLQIESVEPERESVRQCAPFHIAVAGQIQTKHDGLKSLTAFWQAFCREDKQNPRLVYHKYNSHEWNIRLVELGLAPVWATGESGDTKKAKPVKLNHWRKKWPFHKRATGDLPHSYQELVEIAEGMGEPVPDFARFLLNLHGTRGTYGTKYLNHLSLQYRPHQWIRRLNAAMELPLTNEPFERDEWRRSPLDLLNHLAHDGNRLVRWIAQTRLADPHFKFTWQDSE